MQYYYQHTKVFVEYLILNSISEQRQEQNINVAPSQVLYN